MTAAPPGRWQVAAVLPLKGFVDPKRRLAGVLSVARRRGLVEAMARDVLESLCAARGVDSVLLVGPESAVRALAEEYQAGWSIPPPGGLNAAVSHAARLLAECGVAVMLVVHGDLPQLRPQQLECLLDAHRRPCPDCCDREGAATITLVPDHHHTGTSCLACSPPCAMGDFHYGPDSYRRHLLEARRCSLHIHSSPLAQLADVDTADDWRSLCADPPPGTHTTAFLRSVRLPDGQG